MATIVLSKTGASKLAEVPLSNIIQSRIEDLGQDILNQVLDKIRASQVKISLQIDETTDVSHYAQLLVFARYVSGDTYKEEFLFCEPLLEFTT